MSRQETGSQVTSLAALIEQPMLYELGIADHNGYEAKALHFVFQRVAEDMQQPKLTLKIQQTAAQLTVEEVGFRYALYKEHCEDFFEGPYMEKPLLLALFCNNRIFDANAPTTDENGEMIYSERHFDEKEVIDATYIYDQAYELDHCGYDPDAETPIQESLFLAHIHAIEHLNDMGLSLEETPFEDYLPEEIADTQKEFRDIRTYLRPHTQIGAELEQMLGGLEDELLSAWPATSAPVAKYCLPHPANDI